MSRWSLLAALLALPPSGGCGAKSELWVDEPPLDAAADDGALDDGALDDSRADDRGADDGSADDGVPDDGDEPVDRTLAVTAHDDDALQDPGGTMLPRYSWISLYSPEHRGGLRFVLDGVPAHATLLEAVLEVYIDSGVEGDPAETVFRQTGRNPERFSTERNDLGARPLTAESVPWHGTRLREGWTSSPSLVPLLQPLLDAADYVPGDAVVFVLVPGPEAGPGRVFEFRQLDHPGDFAPRLRLSYLPP